jgi:N-acetylglutamate synthase-like GNAT family acetyltransferase
MAIVYKINTAVSAEEVSDLFDRSGLRRPVGDFGRIGRMLKHADEIITAWDGHTLVGIVRAVTDYSYCCYISDVAVDKQMHGLGIGRQLVGMLRAKLGEEEIQYVLTSTSLSAGFYERIGFERADKAYVVKRRRHR